MGTWRNEEGGEERERGRRRKGSSFGVGKIRGEFIILLGIIRRCG